MPVPNHLIGVKGDECQCGRRASVRHCPSCGSSRIYARQRRHHVFVDGSTRLVEVEFRCQTCGHLFVDEEREFCDAPPVGPKLAAQKVKALHEASQTGEYLRPEDQKIADAIKQIEPQKVVYDETTLKQAWFALRRAWLDIQIAAKLQKTTPPPPIAAFLTEHLKEAGYPQQYIDQILEWQRIEEEQTKAVQQ